MDIDITKQCEVGLEFSSKNEALVYLYAPAQPSDEERKKIGLFDKSGFHYMESERTRATYHVEDFYVAHQGITWFKVYERRLA